MIDWEQTQFQLGLVDLSQYRPKVIVRCDQCGKQGVLTIRVKSKLRDNQLFWLCYKCANNKPEVRAKHSSDMKKQWMLDEYCLERSQSSRKRWEDLAYRNRISESASEFWKSSPERKEELHEYYKKKYDNEKYRQKQRERSILLWSQSDFREKVAAGVGRSAVLNGIAPSSLHKVLEEYLNSLKVQFHGEYALGPYVFDYLLENPVGKPILLEIHGDYWHHLAVSVERDKRKATYALRLRDQYDFKVLWEYEFYTRDRIISKLKKWFGIEPAPALVDFSFSDVEIRELGPKPARVFFTQYHYSGSLGRGGLIFGAYLGEELIGAIVYSPVVRKEMAIKQNLSCREVTELSRLAIADHRHKLNFASWLISRTLKRLSEKYKMVIAFADKTFGHDGAVYRASNFELDGTVARSYWYIDQEGWVMHKKTLYEHARSLRMSEGEFAAKYNYRKTYGEEKLRFIYRCR